MENPPVDQNPHRAAPGLSPHGHHSMPMRPQMIWLKKQPAEMNQEHSAAESK
jgi:hypothetical protein